MPAHYKYSPSKLDMIMQCPGCVDLPSIDHESEAALEGTVAHDIAATCIETGGEPEEITEDEEMIAGISMYLDFVRNLLATNPGAQVWIEQQLESPNIVEFGGTIDFAMVHGNRGWIVDFKYGANWKVEAHDNTQLKAYALLLAESQGGSLETVTTYIVQPRNGGISDGYAYTREELYEFALELMRVSKSDELRMGKHCHWCSHAAYCPLMYELIVEIANMRVEDTDKERWEHINELSPAVGRVMREVKGWMLRAMEAGEIFQRHKAVRRLSDRKWAVPEEEVLARFRRKKIPASKVTVKKLLSPPQIEKEGLLDVVEDLVERTEEGISVAPIDDKREAVVFTPPGEEFLDFLN